MTEKEKFNLRITNKVTIRNEEARTERANRQAEKAAKRYEDIQTKHQKKQRIGSIFWYCRKMGIDAAVLAVDLGLNGFLKNNDNDNLGEMLKDVKQRFKLWKIENNKEVL